MVVPVFSMNKRYFPFREARANEISRLCTQVVAQHQFRSAKISVNQPSIPERVNHVENTGRVPLCFALAALSFLARYGRECVQGIQHAGKASFRVAVIQSVERLGGAKQLRLFERHCKEFVVIVKVGYEAVSFISSVFDNEDFRIETAALDSKTGAKGLIG